MSLLTNTWDFIKPFHKMITGGAPKRFAFKLQSFKEKRQISEPALGFLRVDKTILRHKESYFSFYVISIITTRTTHTTTTKTATTTATTKPA